MYRFSICNEQGMNELEGVPTTNEKKSFEGKEQKGDRVDFENDWCFEGRKKRGQKNAVYYCNTHVCRLLGKKPIMNE